MALERWTQAAKKVEELALREALNLGQNYVGPEHILLAIMRNDSYASRALKALGADESRVRNEVIWRLQARPQPVESWSERVDRRLDALEGR